MRLFSPINSWQKQITKKAKRIHSRIHSLKNHISELQHDIDAYRGSLGYPVPGGHDGKLSDGTTPQCGMCNSAHRIELSASLAAQTRRAEGAEKAYLDMCNQRDEARLAVEQSAFAQQKLMHCVEEAERERDEAQRMCAADGMPVFLACSECGYTPDPDLQPELIRRYLTGWLRFQRKLQKQELRGKYDWKGAS